MAAWEAHKDHLAGRQMVRRHWEAQVAKEGAVDLKAARRRRLEAALEVVAGRQMVRRHRAGQWAAMQAPVP